jgi:predicted RNA-binding Zn ribbon-like protein
MREAAHEHDEWIDGFLFVANRPILDFLNTKPVFDGEPTELLSDVPALERWLVASGMVSSAKTKSLMRGWRQSPDTGTFLKELIAFRERLRDAVRRMEDGSAAPEGFVQEVNAGLLQHPPVTVLRKRGGQIVREWFFEPRLPADLWAPIFDAAADLLSEPEADRIRQCEACVIHFFDTSKKGSRRWCSMNICGNKLKVAAYQRRKRNGASTL